VASILCQWTAHPARRRPRELALVVGVVALTAAGVLATFDSGFLAILSVVILLLAVAPFLLPTRYTVTDDGIEAVRALGRRARAWKDLRRVEVGRDAALVSPFARPSWLDRQRGLLLLLDGADRDRVVAILRERIPGDAR
jgi:hypothetical protein